MSVRLQVVMSEDEHAEIRRAAEAARMTVSAWVRTALRDARAVGAARPVGEHGPDYGARPVTSRRVPIELDLEEELLETVRQRHHLPNWRATVEYALRRLAVRPMSREEALAMRGAGWDGDLERSRVGDPGDPW